MYTDLCLRASLYSSFCSGKGLFGDLLTLVLSSLISRRPVFDFWSAATMTLLSVVKDFSLGREHRCFNKYSELEGRRNQSCCKSACKHQGHATRACLLQLTAVTQYKAGDTATHLQSSF